MANGELPAPGAREMTALREGAGWAESARERVDLAGADRVRFLHNLVTCDVRELADGRTTRGFLTHVKGGVLADADVVALADRFRLVLPAGRASAIAAHLARYRIVEQVEIEPRADLVAVELRGARAGELLGALGAPEPAAGERRQAELAGRPVAIRRETRGREPRFEIELAAADHEPVQAEIERAGAGVGLVALSAAATELARIEDAELAWGVDYGEENFPQELGEESAVSYTKGCYLGQEVVARIHYRGGVQRVPRRLLALPGSAPARSAELLLEGRPVGRLTSLALDPASGRRIGLALVHRRAAATGSPLVTAAGDRLEVLAEPA